MVFMGIDPGDKGSACILDANGKPVKSADGLRVIQFGHVGSTEEFIAEWFRLVSKMYDIKCSLEFVGPRPRFSVQSQFYLSDSAGFLRALLVANKINFVRTTPQSWQSTLGIAGRTPAEKKKPQLFKQRLREKAQQLWPKLGSFIVSGNADSFLIAEALRRQTNGKPNAKSKK